MLFKLLKKSVIIFLIIFIILNIKSNAADYDNVLTLSEAIKTGILKNKSVENIQKALESAQINYSSVQKERYPKISTTYSYLGLNKELDVELADPISGATNEYTFLPRNNYSWMTSLSLPIYSGGTQEISEEIAKLGIDISKLKLLQAKNELIFQIKCYYYICLKNQKNIDYLNDNLKACQKHEKLTNIYHEQGLVAKNSVLEARVETLNAEQELESAKQALTVSLASLNTAMGLDLDNEIKIEDILKKNEFNFTYEDCIKSAKENNPELVAFAFLKAQAEKAISLEYSYYVPKIDLSANYLKSGDTIGLQPNNIFPGDILYSMVNLNWRLFDWGQKADDAKIKRKELEQIINNEKLCNDNIKLKIKDYYSQLKVSEKNIELSKASIVSANENVRITNIRFKEQLATSTEVVDALTALKKTEANYYTSLYNNNISASYLEQLLGIEINKIIGEGK